MNAIYPFSGTIMMIGMIAILYGIHSVSFTLLIEGFFLLWLGFSITVSIWDARH